MKPNRTLWEMVALAPDGEGGAAAASAPAPSGGETVVSGETSVPGDSSPGSDFSGLDMDFTDDLDDSNSVVVETPPAASAPATVPPAAAPTSAAPAQPAAAEAPKAPTPPPAPAAAVPGAQPQPAPQEQPAANAAQAPASVPADAAGLLKELETHRDGVIAALAADPRFALTQDEATLLETDPGRAVPQLLARTYYQAISAALTHINNFVPGMVARHVEGSRLQNERETAFYSKFQGLKKEVHGNDVLTFAKIFRSQNPNMAMPELFDLVGAAVMAKNGIVPGPMAPSAANGRPPQPAVQTPPFAPASPGATVRTTPVEESPFAGLGRDWDE